MMLRKWEDLPQEMRTEEVRPYYDLLRKKQGSLLCKRLFDILASLVAGCFVGWSVAYARIRNMEKNLDIHIFCNGH